MPDTKLESCPFCGLSDNVASTWDKSNDAHYVECDRCEVSGPSMDTRLDAVAAWNDRPALTPKQKAAADGMAKALELVYEEGMKSEAIDCGDHCHSGCMWCAVSSAFAAYREAVNVNA